MNFCFSVSDMREVPVSLEQFISDPEFLGKYTNDGKLIYEFWKEKLEDIFESESNRVMFATAIGTGRSTACAVSIAYWLYQFMLLKDPYETYGFKDSRGIEREFKFVFSGPHVDPEFLGMHQYQIVFNELMCMFKESEWFRTNGEFEYKEDMFGNISSNPVSYLSNNGIRIICAENVSYVGNSNIVGVYYDCYPDRNGQYNNTTDSFWGYYHALHGILPFTLKFKMATVMFVEYDISEFGKLDLERIGFKSIRGSQYLIKPHIHTYNSGYYLIYNPVVGKSRIVTGDEEETVEISPGEKIIPIPDDKYAFEHDLDNTIKQILNLDLTVYEHGVPFSEAYPKLISEKYVIEYETADHVKHSYYVKDGILYESSYDRRPSEASFSNVALLSRFINCDNWTVYPVKLLISEGD